MSRLLLTDGVNSLAHVTLGMIGGELLAVPFILYQLTEEDENAAVDISEYLLGWLFVSLLSNKSKLPHIRW